jgi:hypothetical protein
MPSWFEGAIAVFGGVFHFAFLLLRLRRCFRKLAASRIPIEQFRQLRETASSRASSIVRNPVCPAMFGSDRP